MKADEIRKWHDDLLHPVEAIRTRARIEIAALADLKRGMK
jgi:hypothetical protein